MAEWKVFDDFDIPQCTRCGMGMPYARYRRKYGVDARWITNYCPYCGDKMTAIPMCKSCSYGKGEWKDDGICNCCKEQLWVPRSDHVKVGEERL